MHTHLCAVCNQGFDTSEIMEDDGKVYCMTCHALMRKRQGGRRADHRREVFNFDLPDAPPTVWEKIRDTSKKIVSGILWWARIPLLGYYLNVLVLHIVDPAYESVFGPLNHRLHQLGHYAFGILGEEGAVLGGTMLPLFLPIIFMAYFLNRRDLFSMSICFGWFATVLFNVALFAADASKGDLICLMPLSGREFQDWAWILERVNMVDHAHVVSMVLKLSGYFTMMVCLAACIWFLWQIILNQKSKAQWVIKKIKRLWAGG